MFVYKILVTFFVLLILHIEPSFGGFEVYSKPCEHNDQCSTADFRLICHKSLSVCQCSEFYYWNEPFQECHVNQSRLNNWFNNHKERHIVDELNHDASVVFMSIALAGVVSLSLGLSLAILCVLYACLFRHESPSLPSTKTVPPTTKPAPSVSGTQKTK